MFCFISGELFIIADYAMIFSVFAVTTFQSCKMRHVSE